MASYVSYILVSNKRMKKTNIVQTGILLTQTKHHTLSHSDTFTQIFTSITNPICLIFLLFLLFLF